jgi:hypothetical protein
MARSSGSAFTIVNNGNISRGNQLSQLARSKNKIPNHRVVGPSLRMLVRLEEAALAHSLANPIAAVASKASNLESQVKSQVEPQVKPQVEPQVKPKRKQEVKDGGTTFFHDDCRMVFGEVGMLETLVDWMSDFKRREIRFHPDPSALGTLSTVISDALAKNADVSINDLPPSADDRLMALQWLQSIATDFQIERQTVQLACNAIDRILALEAHHLTQQQPSPYHHHHFSPSTAGATGVTGVTGVTGMEGVEGRWVISRRRFQLLVTACLWTMYKSEEDGDLSCEAFVIPSGDACTVPTMIEMEQFVCRSLDFRWHAATIDDAMTFLLQFLLHLLSQYRRAFQILCSKSSSEESTITQALDCCRGMPALQWPSSATNEQARLELVNRWIKIVTNLTAYWRMSTLADLATLDSRSLSHFPSAIAASILIGEFQQPIISNNDRTCSTNFVALTLFASGYTLPTLASCIKWLQTLRQLARDDHPVSKKHDQGDQGVPHQGDQGVPHQGDQGVPHQGDQWAFRLQRSFPNSLTIIRTATATATASAHNNSLLEHKTPSPKISPSSSLKPMKATSSVVATSCSMQASKQHSITTITTINNTIMYTTATNDLSVPMILA